MSAITRARKNLRKGHARWRCGACLFELPNHVMLIPEDTPFNAIRLPALESEMEQKFLKQPLIVISAERGCVRCRLMMGFSQVSGSMRLVWARGTIQSWGIGPKGGVQFFIPEDEVELKYPFSFHPFVDHGGFPSGDTGSTEALRKALAWMHKCCHEHQACAQSFKATQMPKRILFIKDMGLRDIRLIEDADMLPSEPYVCLSHRWMPETLLARLTKERSQTFQQGIPKELLYPLLVDALKATFFLGFKYIWIDCLCIYQDDLEDWSSSSGNVDNLRTGCIDYLRSVL
ncbi:putative het domain-containing protein [Seiridium unicorne]|uniref:Het domain-containing protein n=1 Tax=Seiridium unicorne TaxID=138068 RepID=A0ABR2V9E2_9PEZI